MDVENLLTDMSIPKGGRGIKAPYETTHVRVPVPVKDHVQSMIDRYKEHGTLDVENSLTTFDEAVISAQAILSQKKSARVSMEKLLTAIYGQDVKL